MSCNFNCATCGKPATKLCSGCKKVSYCSAEHQKSDWKCHKSSCRIYILKKNDIMGRYIVAAKDIPAGSLILDEPALMIGPKQDSLPICLGCHKRVKGPYLCSRCTLPVCNEECEQLKIHSENECTIFSKKKTILKFVDFGVHHPVYQCILTLRCLLLKNKDSALWDKLNTMEHHNDLRKELSLLWDRNQVNTVNYLREGHGLDYFDPMVIHSVLGYSDINAFEIKANGIEICGLFPEVALMAHDCVSNTHHSITEDYRMIIRSTILIKKGDMITTTYTHTLEGTMLRRAHILDAKLFACCCKRCASPTELETNFSSVKCLSCTHGYLIPKDSLNPISVWECSECLKPESVESIKSLVDSIRKEIESIEKDRQETPIHRLELILKKYSGVRLHPQHCLMVGVLHSLSQYYGSIKDFTMEELTMEHLQRKEETCRQLLKVLDVIEPGMSRIRGLTLYELHAAVFFGAQKRFKSGLMEVDKLEENLQEVIQLLTTSMEILSFDCPSTSTGKIAKTIPQSLEGVRQIMRHFCK